MRRELILILPLLSVACCIDISLAADCDNPQAPESVRIYYANGMFNSSEDADESREKLQKILGMAERDFGRAYNDNENWFVQLLEFYRQKKNSSDEFWYWLRNMDEAPKWFHDEYVQRVSRFNEDFVKSQSFPVWPSYSSPFINFVLFCLRIVSVCFQFGQKRGQSGFFGRKYQNFAAPLRSSFPMGAESNGV